MKNNTLHKQLKKFQDMWVNAEVKLMEHKLILAEGATEALEQAPENRDELRVYVNVDLRKMLTDLKSRFLQADNQRRHIMTEFPVVKLNN